MTLQITLTTTEIRSCNYCKRQGHTLKDVESAKDALTRMLQPSPLPLSYFGLISLTLFPYIIYPGKFRGSANVIWEAILETLIALID
jgi:hypothetical protein